MPKNRIESSKFQEISSAALASGVGLDAPDFANYCVVQCEGGDVRWRDDGTNPSSTTGMKMSSGAELTFDGSMDKVQFITASGTPKLMVTYYS